MRHYFEAHRVTVVTSFLLEHVLHNHDATGRIAEWALELSGFGLHFTNTHVIKSRALPKFLVEWTPTPKSKVEERSFLPRNEDPKHWVMFFDGSFSLQGMGAGVVLISPMGEHLRYVVQLLFKDGKATNNTVEYDGFLAGHRAAAALDIKLLVINGDSQLVVNQVMKDYECPNPQMAVYVAEVRKIERHFDGL